MLNDSTCVEITGIYLNIFQLSLADESSMQWRKDTHLKSRKCSYGLKSDGKNDIVRLHCFSITPIETLFTFQIKDIFSS